MTMNSLRWRWVGAISLVVFEVNSTSAQLGAGTTKAKLRLHSSVKEVVRGEAFDVAVQFKIDDGWHIYWQNSGDAGKSPTLSWSLQPGFTADEPRFPVPKLHKAPGDLITNIHEGEPVLLVRLNPPSNLSGETVSLKAKVNYLICEEKCLLEVAELALDLPLKPHGSQVSPDNEDLFKRARNALPRENSRYLKIEAALIPVKPVPSQPIEMVVTVNFTPGYHIQSNAPLTENLIPTVLFVRRTPEVAFDRPVFPVARVRELKSNIKVAEFAGKTEIRVRGSVEGELPPGPMKFGGVLKFQACNEEGTCFPPEAVEFSLVADAAVSAPAPDPSGGGTIALAPVPAPTTPAPQPPDQAAPPTSLVPQKSLLTWLGFAFLGGLILNVMPCVLPVISIKMLSFVQQAGEEPGRVFRLGMTFVAGILVSFVALALTLMLLKTAGRQLGWGFQFQSPCFLIVMISAVFVFGLSFFGVFSFNLPGATLSTLSQAEAREGYLGTFMKGVLSTVLATPCTAPLLGSALGFAIASPNSIMLLIFVMVGLGMASPFILLSLNPRWLRFLPRPGAWMERFKQFMGFVLMGTVAWLMFPLGSLIGATGLVWTLAFLTCLGLACWVVGLQTPLTRSDHRVVGWAVAIMLAVVGWWASFTRGANLEGLIAQARAARMGGDFVMGGKPIKVGDCDDHIPWQTWSKGLAERLASDGYTVYVDYTADWCLNCQVNKKVVLESEEIRKRFCELCVIPLKADFTHFDPDIFSDLQRFGRGGVPLNLIYSPGKPDKPVLLPELLVGMGDKVLDHLQAAGPSRGCGSLTLAE